MRRRRKRRHHGRRHHHSPRRRRNPIEWAPLLIGLGMGGLLTFFYIKTVTTPSTAAALPASGTTTSTTG